jgi:ADP-ribosyl-[dinitrogen reductase] hydrolase
MSDLLNRFKGSLIGLAVGDALGAPYEFRTPAEPIRNYREGGRLNMTKGEWTDDTSMALCLARSLIDRRGFDLKDQMTRYSRWLYEGYMSTRKESLGSGSTTRSSIKQFKETGNALAGISDAEKAGNGCIMRLAPVPLFFHNNMVQVAKYSAESCKTTHGALECIECSALLGEIIARCMSANSKEQVLRHYGWISMFNSPKVLHLSMKGHLLEPGELKPQGAYVVDSLKLALRCFWRSESFEDAVIMAVNTPGDRDTFGAITGQIAGAFYGFDAIPKQWVDDLMMCDLIAETAEQLYQESIKGNFVEYPYLPPMEGPKVGISIIVAKDNKMLVGKRIGAHGEGTWGLPGGHLEAGEEWHECASRELEEETGLKISDFEFLGVENVIFEEERKHYVDICLGAYYSGDQEPEAKEPNRCLKWEWATLEEFVTLQPKFKCLKQHILSGVIKKVLNKEKNSL